MVCNSFTFFTKSFHYLQLPRDYLQLPDIWIMVICSVLEIIGLLPRHICHTGHLFSGIGVRFRTKMSRWTLVQGGHMFSASPHFTGHMFSENADRA